MDANGGTKNERGIDSHAINAQYAAFAQDGEVHVQSLDSPARSTFGFRHGTTRADSIPVLAFSSVKVNLLAAANGTHILIYDAKSQRVERVLKGNGHVVTSICFSSSDRNTVASGSVDGTICIWSLKEPSRPVYQLPSSSGPCTNIALNPHNPRALVACYQDCISVWVWPAVHPKAVSQLSEATPELLCWCPNNNGRILIASRKGRLTVCNVRNVIGGKSPQPGSGNEHEDPDPEDGIMFGEPEGLKQPPSNSFDLGHPIAQSYLLGHHGIALLPQAARVIYFYSYSFDADEPTELWRLSVGSGVKCFALRTCKASVETIAFFDDGHQIFDVPTPVLDGMGWTYGRSLQGLPMLGPDLTETPRQTHATMLPHKISARQNPKRRRQDTGKETRSAISRIKKQRKKPSLEGVMNGRIAAKSLVASLELPRIAPTEDDSPMPFLSPSIPARKVSPGSITPLDEMVKLPPQATFDSMSSAATQGHESDSDDEETFAPNMQGSGTLLPGGVNVPLPRTCGAYFGPNGQLVTFFPIRMKAAILEENLENRDTALGTSYGEEATKLFPTFGNLGSANAHIDDADSVGSVDATLGNTPKFAIQASSFDSRPSWSAKISPVKAGSGAFAGQQGVNVAIRDMENLTPTRRSLAAKYELVPREQASESDACRANAIHAEAEGLDESAHAWRLLALTLEQKGARKLATGEPYPALSIRPKVSRNSTMVPDPITSSLRGDGTAFLDPVGGTWAIEELFSWAETRADVQLLASMSCFIVKGPPPSHFERQNIATYASYFVDHSAISPPGVPNFRTALSTPRTVSDSLVKLGGSRVSSRNPSQPTTPYLDSSTSTPPMTLPTLSRQTSTGISISGSASPEHHRSSFGTAARNYAASIAEKFGSYGSSPPTKRFDNSPSELPSSLPPGSLGKSVSFASGINGTSTVRRSLSLAQEDDNYDSDRTIDDGSLPHTPKNNSVSFKPKQTHFFDEMSTGHTTAGLPAELAIKCKIWRQHYAEHLRAWDLVLAGAELENVADYERAPTALSKSPPSAVMPSNTMRKRTTCTVCFCLIQAAQQVCAHCLHTTHPACLEDFIAASADMSFACPAGCGCDCSSAHEAYSFRVDGDDIVSIKAPSRPQFSKRPSFTDPLRVRQRLQGESW